MTRNKKKTPSEASALVADAPVAQQDRLTLLNMPLSKASAEKSRKLSKAPAPEHSCSALIICRNKHWRYISSFHGPWLQLPPEVLEGLAYNNYYSPRPHPIDPALFFDLVKIRRLVEDATSLAVRAANGTASSSLSNAYSGSHGTDAEMLGLGNPRNGGNAKLSRERKHRMREQATQKLSHAYYLDEIAASVATMQSASALEDVANFVLQRNEDDADAKYVHFFHEKIPSRSMAESTSLKPLDEVILQKPTEASPYRTRAVTRLFQHDFLGAVRDLTDGLAVHRVYSDQHKRINQQRDLILARDAARVARDYSRDAKVADEDQPSGLEPQMLFHRAGAFLTLACDQIDFAVKDDPHTPSHPQKVQRDGNIVDVAATPEHLESCRERLDALKLVRSYAKRALRDYMSFLSHFEYSPGISAEFTESLLEKISGSNGYGNHSKQSRSESLLDISSDHGDITAASDALIRYERKAQAQDLPPIPRPPIYRLGQLFDPVPSPDLPPYPTTQPHVTSPTSNHSIFSLPDFSEGLTYHPLLTDVLHSLLLCHCLVQTSPKEHLRHAYMVARLTRLCDGFPVFLSARSPARADWVEVVRRSDNWLGLQSSWESLCASDTLPSPSQSKSNRNGGTTEKQRKAETLEEKHERTRLAAIRDALADDRVLDEPAFRASVRARQEKLAREEEEEQRKEYMLTTAGRFSDRVMANDATSSVSSRDGSKTSKHASGNGKSYQISTERADAIVTWIQNAPPASTSSEGKSAKKKPRKAARLRRERSDLTQSSMQDLGRSVESLSFDAVDEVDSLPGMLGSIDWTSSRERTCSLAGDTLR